MQDRFSWSYLLAVAARAIRDLATLRRRATRVGKRIPTFTLHSELQFASPQILHAFADELTTEIARLAQKYQSLDGGRYFTFFVGAYPTVTPDGEGALLATTT